MHPVRRVRRKLPRTGTKSRIRGCCSFRFKTKCLFRAACDALPAADASFFFVSHKGLRFNAFRVVAPPAGQRASFHKDRGADARAVMDRISFNVEYKTCGHFHPAPLPGISRPSFAMRRSIGTLASKRLPKYPDGCACTGPLVCSHR